MKINSVATFSIANSGHPFATDSSEEHLIKAVAVMYGAVINLYIAPGQVVTGLQNRITGVAGEHVLKVYMIMFIPN